MRIKYITNVRLPTGRAAGYAIMKMCSAFAKAGIDTELWVPKRGNNDNKQDPFLFYGVEKNFNIKRIPSFDFLATTLKFGRIFYWLDILSFLVPLQFKVKLAGDDVLYTRDFVTALFLPKRNRIILELHSIPKSKFLFHRAVKAADLFVVLTHAIKNELVNLGVPNENILISPSGVDLNQFNAAADNFEIEGIKQDDFVYGYIGSLKTMSMEKGLSVGLEALANLPQSYKFLIVGGESDDIKYYKRMAESLNVNDRVIFTGQVPNTEIYKYSGLCSVLVAPFPENEHYSYYMSPLKIFEYMASKKPIIATDLPSLREILIDGENAILVPPGSSIALAEAIKRLSEDTALGAKLAGNAYFEVKKYTWETRAKNILNFIHK